MWHFSCKAKKLQFLAVLTWFLILGEIQDGSQDGDHSWWHHRPPAEPPPVKYTSSWDFPVKIKSFRNTVTYQKLQGGVPSTPPPPMYYGGGMSLRVRPTINQTSFLAVKTVLSWHPRTFVSTKKIWEEQFGFIVGWKNCRHFSTPPLVSQRNDVWGTSSEIPWERTILMICVVLLINYAARETFFNLSEALLRSW